MEAIPEGFGKLSCAKLESQPGSAGMGAGAEQLGPEQSALLALCSITPGMWGQRNQAGRVFWAKAGRERGRDICEYLKRAARSWCPSHRAPDGNPSCAEASSHATLCSIAGIYCYWGLEMLEKCHRALCYAKIYLLAHPQPF